MPEVRRISFDSSGEQKRMNPQLTEIGTGFNTLVYSQPLDVFHYRSQRPVLQELDGVYFSRD